MVDHTKWALSWVSATDDIANKELPHVTTKWIAIGEDQLGLPLIHGTDFELKVLLLIALKSGGDVFSRQDTVALVIEQNPDSQE